MQKDTIKLEDFVYPIVFEKGMDDFYFQQDVMRLRSVMATLRSKFSGKLIKVPGC